MNGDNEAQTEMNGDNEAQAEMNGDNGLFHADFSPIYGPHRSS